MVMRWTTDDLPNSRSSSGGWRPDRCDRVALVLQGGGALGAYQAGVYQALHEAGIEPDWVWAFRSAPSIRRSSPAIRRSAGSTAARPSGSASPSARSGTTRRTATSSARRAISTSSFMTTMLGQPGFFTPRQPNPWLSLAGAQTATSYYDTAPLRETLLETRRFRPDQCEAVRFSVGAVNVLTRKFRLFRQCQHEMIEPEHMMASGALPPALPMVQDRHRSFLGRRHRLQHAAAASARPGRRPQLAGVPGRPVQRRGVAAARHPGRDRAPQGHHVFVAHPPQHRRLPAHPQPEAALHKALAKVPEDELSDEERTCGRARQSA